MANVISFTAAVAKVQTLADSSPRATFDLGENGLMAMAQLAECQRHGIVLQIEATPMEVKSYGKSSTNKPERKHLRKKATAETVE